MKLSVAKADSDRPATDVGWWIAIGLISLLAVYFGLANHLVARSISGLLSALVALLNSIRLRQRNTGMIWSKSLTVFLGLFGGAWLLSILVN